MSPTVSRLAAGVRVPMVVAAVSTTAIMITWVSTAPTAVSWRDRLMVVVVRCLSITAPCW